MDTNDQQHTSTQQHAPLVVPIPDAARLLGVGRSTYALIVSGELEVIHIGRCVRVPVAAIDEPSGLLHQVRLLVATGVSGLG